MIEPDLWSSFHFALSAEGCDPRGLLRGVADHLERIGPVQVHDITFRLLPDEDGIRSVSEMTVYYDRLRIEADAAT
jgi:hypothetical protein